MRASTDDDALTDALIAQLYVGRHDARRFCRTLVTRVKAGPARPNSLWPHSSPPDHSSHALSAWAVDLKASKWQSARSTVVNRGGASLRFLLVASRAGRRRLKIAEVIRDASDGEQHLHGPSIVHVRLSDGFDQFV
jgi:hypothetical protein